MQKNTPELWDTLWQKTLLQKEQHSLIREENSIRWQRIEKKIQAKFGGFKGLRVIEIGAGIGTNALLFAKRGAKVTLLDYSKEAITKSKEFFKRNRCKADFVLADALNLPEKLKGKYDVAMSFGLAEHFKGRDRHQIISSHLDLTNKKGLILISVPNKHNIPYRINRFVRELAGFWEFGQENPFSRGEFLKIGELFKIKKIEFIGDSFLGSFKFVNPLAAIRKKYNLKAKPKKEKGSFLDAYFAYALVFLGEKS